MKFNSLTNFEITYFVILFSQYDQSQKINVVSNCGCVQHFSRLQIVSFLKIGVAGGAAAADEEFAFDGSDEKNKFGNILGEPCYIALIIEKFSQNHIIILFSQSV